MSHCFACLMLVYQGNVKQPHIVPLLPIVMASWDLSNFIQVWFLEKIYGVHCVQSQIKHVINHCYVCVINLSQRIASTFLCLNTQSASQDSHVLLLFHPYSLSMVSCCQIAMLTQFACQPINLIVLVKCGFMQIRQFNDNYERKFHMIWLTQSSIKCSTVLAPQKIRINNMFGLNLETCQS